MLKTIYFHVGTVKTGSTLIQKMLWENKELLKDFDASYFDLVSPKLSYPRYANAEFLLDPSEKVSDDRIIEYLDGLDVSNTVISEEGLWANIELISNPIFDKYNKVVVLYVRKPADVIAAWASENAEPYNAKQKIHASGMGVVPIDLGIAEFTSRYSKIFKDFFKKIENIKIDELIVRPYDRSRFYNNDIFCDFLEVINVDPTLFFQKKDINVVKVANTSRSRKFCDISCSVFEAMRELGFESDYSLDVVNFVYTNSRYGDDRPIIDTLDDEIIKSVVDELEFIETEISNNYLGGESLFENRYPPIYDVERFPYQPLDKDELEKLTYKYLLSSINKPSTNENKSDNSPNGAPDAWSRDKLIGEYKKKVRGLQYTIGERERLKTLWSMIGQILTDENSKTVSKIIKCLPESLADRWQDIFALLLSGGKEGGFFVEFGACDGVFASNTFVLEKHFGWKGVLAEAAHIWHEKLDENRTANVDRRCLSSTTGEQLEFYQGTSANLSSPGGKSKFLKEVEEKYMVETVSLMDLLKDHKAPKFIDFLSIDTEGHEKEILSSFDFDSYKFGFICVEQHEPLTSDNDVTGLLEEVGYKILFPREKGRPTPMEISGVDMFFVPKDSEDFK